MPRNWIYSFKTQYAWIYTISWSNSDEKLDRCDVPTGNGTLSIYKFKDDRNNIENFDKTYGLMYIEVKKS